METTIHLQSIVIISILAFISPIVLHCFKKINIPFVVGEIFVGIIVGKSFLNLIHNDIWLVFLSNLGLAYLMFLSGLEIDMEDLSPKDSNKKGGKVIALSIIMFIISLLLSFIIAKIFYKFNITKNILFFTFLLASSAPGIVVPFLKERQLLSSTYGQMILIFTLICEFICLIAITILSSSNNGLSYKNFLFVIVLLVSYIVYIIAKKLLKTFDFTKASFQALHLEVRAAFALIFILASLSHVVGSEIILGSFLAGIIFSLISKNGKEDLKYKLDIIGYGFLIPIFFIEVGVNLDISSIFNNYSSLILLPILLIAFYIVKSVPSLLISKYYGFNKGISSSFILSTQLSLTIVGAQIAFNLNIISQSVYSMLIISTIVSCVIFPILFDKTFNFKDITKKTTTSLDKISIRETVVSNSEVFNKSLKDIKFPRGCRVFLLIRDEHEIVPDGNTIVKEGDVLILGGIKDKEEMMLKVINKTF